MSLRHLSFQDMEGGYKADLIVVASSVFVLEWLADYLEASHSATASIDDCMAIAISLVREAVQLAEVLP